MRVTTRSDASNENQVNESPEPIGGGQTTDGGAHTKVGASNVGAPLTPGTLAWIAVVSTLPIHKLITNSYGLYTYLVLALIVGCVLLGRYERPAGAVVWAASVPLILIASLLSGIYSSMPRSLLVGIQLSIIVGLAPFVFRHYAVKSDRFTRYSLIGFGSVQTVSSIAGLVQLTGVPVLGMVANSGRANGLATHPNILGLMAALTVLLCVAGSVKSRGRLRFLFASAAIVNFAALIGSGSLSSMLSLAGGAIVLLFASRTTIRTIALTAICAVLLAVGGTFLGFEYSMLTESVEDRVNTVTGVSDDGVASVSIREATYAFAIDSIRDDPISGVGMDSMNQGTYNGITVVHNYILRSWYQGGVLLFVAMTLITGFLAYRVTKATVTGKEPLQAAIIVSVITFALTSAFYTQQQYWLPVIFAVAQLATKDARFNRTGAHES